jgi:hypothetical protein
VGFLGKPTMNERVETAGTMRACRTSGRATANRWANIRVVLHVVRRIDKTERSLEMLGQD